MKQQAEATGYTIELVPHPKSDNVETEKRRSEVVNLLNQMYLRAKKKGRPSKEEGTVKNAA